MWPTATIAASLGADPDVSLKPRGGRGWVQCTEPRRNPSRPRSKWPPATLRVSAHLSDDAKSRLGRPRATAKRPRNVGCPRGRSSALSVDVHELIVTPRDAPVTPAVTRDRPRDKGLARGFEAPPKGVSGGLSPVVSPGDRWGRQPFTEAFRQAFPEAFRVG